MTDSPASAQPLGERGLLGEGAEEHGAECVERLDDAPVREAVAHGGAVAFGRDEAPLAEDLEMPRHSRLRHVESLGKLGDGPGPLGEGVEDEDALRVGQRLTDAGVQQVHFPFEAFVHWRTPSGEPTGGACGTGRRDLTLLVADTFEHALIRLRLRISASKELVSRVTNTV